MNIVILFLLIGLIILILFIQKKNKQEFEKVAFIDPVTKGINYAKFEIEATKLINSNPVNTYAFVSLDIDKFKLINDAFGSEAGNRTLKYIFNVIASHINKDEIVVRATEDTFYILIKNSSQENIIKRLNDIVKDINSYNSVREHKYYLTIIQGVYVIDEPSLSIITIQDRANSARKNAKKSNLGYKGSCIFYTDIERIKMIYEKEIDNKMESALINREFIIYLQPKYELVNDTIAGAEALVRWNDPERGIIPPDDFIPVFEKNGFIIKLDLYVFDEVCKLIQMWINQSIDPVPISVNLSRVHLNNPNFLNDYKEIFKKYDIPPSLIEIELTETVVFENMNMLIDVINDIHEFGFTCSLDDFGSGYSSLNILKDISVDALKLDKLFFKIKDEDNERGDYIVESVIELAKKLKIKSISEGVETIPQVQFLKKTKCDMVQGYVFSKPMSAVEFELLLFRRNNFKSKA